MRGFVTERMIAVEERMRRKEDARLWSDVMRHNGNANCQPSALTNLR